MKFRIKKIHKDYCGERVAEIEVPKKIWDFVREKYRNEELCYFSYKDSRVHIEIGAVWDGSFHDPQPTLKAEAVILRQGFFKRLRRKLKEAEVFFEKKMTGEKDDIYAVLNGVERNNHILESIRRWELSRKNV